MKKHLILFILILVCTAATAAAYTRITSRSGDSPRWPSMPISYWIHDQGSRHISNGSEFNAIHASFRAWQNIQNADISFNYRGTTSVRNSGQDGMNLVTFADDSVPLGSSTIAVTLSWFGADINRTSIVQEADIVFSSALEFSTSGEVEKFDIQSVMTHEIGHMLGLDHSGLVSSVMVPFAAPSQTDQRTLAYDDIAGAMEIYPRAVLVSIGQIRGNTLLNGSAIFGAHVVAVDRDGTPLVSTISQPDGSFHIRSLPPGAYRLYAEPLDNPVTNEHIGGGSTSWYRNLRTDFGTTYHGNAVRLSEAATINVTAGGIATADINLLPRSTTNLNLTRPGFAPRISRGSSYLLRIGGEDVTSGLSITTSDPAIVLGAPSYGGRLTTVAPTSVSMDLSVPLSAAVGPKNIAVNRGGNTSVVSGAIVITDPSPSNLAISANTGPSASTTAVTITGENFRAGAQPYFGGLPAQNVRVVDSGTILANTPMNIDPLTMQLVPGAVNVQVFNTDGTVGVMTRGFTYTSPPPSITRVTPLSGSPTTVVTIDGNQFTTLTQNIEVRFNGVVGRVTSATPTSIQAIVPFGATSGPITVSVFGQLATGPNFTVTAATESSNFASRSYNFIDATPAGGGTNHSFNMQDDGLAFTTLPFNFSLFRDIYLAGSRISISTNGWLSLETVSTPEFQNASLPAQTVTRPGGSAGSVPPSLIAPFWDDLILRSGVSSISTRTVGTAPNRQFVVQWSRVSILDEVATDLNASLTFEAVLFEGSNDIQFVYQTLTGPRSDGSSATIGAQDLKRTTAVQRGFNQAGMIRSSQFITYRFQDGAYAASVPDTTPPSRPIVTDGGIATASRTELSASWISEDAESGIREYQYAIGRTAGGADIRPYTTTAQSSVVVTGLNLEVGATYYFAVRAVNNEGLTSEAGVSDGIRVDPTVQTHFKIIPSSPHNSAEFGGIALLAPAAMSVTLKALDSTGALVSGAGVRNPITLNMTAGQQYARMIPELFGIATFDGWIEVEASAPGLGVYSATGAWNLSYLDGTAAGDLTGDFMLYHAGGSAIFVNPSPRAANVVMGSQTFAVPARNRMVVPITAPVRVVSSEPLAVVERFSSSGKLGVSAPAAVSNASSSLVFPHAVVGAGYTSTLRVSNVSPTFRTVNIAFAGLSAEISMDPNSTTQVSVGQLLGITGDLMRTGAVRLNQVSTPFGSPLPSLVGVLDIENASAIATLNARPASTEFSFAHVAHGDGLFTGLCFATGNQAANITIEVYDGAGGAPRIGTLSLEPNQQVGRLISEFVTSVTRQMGGYIRIRSNQPIWSWEIYGSDQVMASAPPVQ